MASETVSSAFFVRACFRPAWKGEGDCAGVSVGESTDRDECDPDDRLVFKLGEAKWCKADFGVSWARLCRACSSCRVCLGAGMVFFWCVLLAGDSV
jgi:hypothetical protein